MLKHLAVTMLALTVASATAAAPSQAPRSIIPAAASTAGLAGSHWRTDLVVHNPSEHGAELVIELISGGLDDTDAVVLPDLLDPRETVILEDVIGTHFPDHATGALVVVGRSPAGPVPLVVGSRTWTPSPSDIGTLGQGIGAIPWRGGDLMDEERVVVGLESSDDARTNVGLVNPTWTYIETFRIEVLDADGTSVGTVYHALEPRTHLQRNDILRALGLEGSGYSAKIRLTRWEDITPGAADGPPAPPQVDWVAYASRVDNHSNDPSFREAQSEVKRWGPPRHRVLPAAASTPGVGSTVWTTDLSLHYPGPAASTFVIVELVPTGGEGIGDGRPERYILSMGQGETLDVEDALGELFPDHDLAALVIQSMAGTQGVSDIRVGSRTWTPAGDGVGTMGQGIPGYSRAETSDPVVIAGLEEGDEFRSNLGLVNLSMNLRSTFSVEVFDSGGTAVGELSYTLEPWSHLQINRLLGELGLSGSGFTARVSLAATENLYLQPSESWDPIFLAYGSRVDQVSGDPAYLEGVPLRSDTGGGGDWYDFDWDEPWYRCPDEPIAEGATVVRAFDRDYHWWGSENHRDILQEVDFPDGGDWNQIGLRLHLECPENGLCDHWDRTGSLQLVLNPDEPQDQWQYLELMRHITPYRVEMCQYVDVTPLAPLLSGRRTLVSWIDTWVGPGHPDGEGWRISFDFVFYPGDPRGADEVVNIWGRRNITLGYTDPDRNVDSQIDPVEVAIPADATRVEARLTTTGHSFGNTDNCAEFCVLRQDLYVDGERRSVVPWRTDCEHNAVRGQQGTWTYDRNGWCPGAIVVGDTIDITDLVTPGSTAAIDFDIRTFEGDEYVNTNPANYDPLEWISLQLYVWRE
jgi:hypothetical protein